MEIETVRKLLADIALDDSFQKPAKHIQDVATALLHIAESVNTMETKIDNLWELSNR